MTKYFQPQKGGRPVRHLDLTKKAMEKVIILKASTQTAELLRLAASHKEISRSEFIRQAIKEKAGRVLAGVDTVSVESA